MNGDRGRCRGRPERCACHLNCDVACSRAWEDRDR